MASLKTIEKSLGRECMTVADLIEELQQFDPKCRVVIASDYGDITHTQQIVAVATADEVFTDQICSTAYSASGLAIGEGDEADDDDSDSVVVLNLR